MTLVLKPFDITGQRHYIIFYLTVNVKWCTLVDMIENNLRAMIAQYKRDNPAESNKTIAVKKGVTPETVSRHSSDKIDMSMQDIRDYAEILGCTTMDIIYTSPPVPMLAIATCTDDDGPLMYHQHISPGDAKVCYIHGNFDADLGCAKIELPAKYQGRYKWLDGGIEIFPKTPCITNTVSPDAFMKPCLVRAVDENIYSGTLFPQAGSHLYSIVPTYGDSKSIICDLELEWATPIISYILRPDHLNAEFVPANYHPHSEKVINEMFESMNARRKRKGMKLLK